MLDSGVDIQPLQLGLFVKRNQVHIVACTQAVVGTDSRQFASGGS
jgi:hypothetical protein